MPRVVDRFQDDFHAQAPLRSHLSGLCLDSRRWLPHRRAQLRAFQDAVALAIKPDDVVIRSIRDHIRDCTDCLRDLVTYTRMLSVVTSECEVCHDRI